MAGQCPGVGRVTSCQRHGNRPDRLREGRCRRPALPFRPHQKPLSARRTRRRSPTGWRGTGSDGRLSRTRSGIQGQQAYSFRGNRAHLRRRGIEAVIPEKRDQAANRKTKGRRGGRPVDHDAEFYKERNTVERLINKLKAWRGIVTRYDETPEGYLAGLHLRASVMWIKDLTRTRAESRAGHRGA